ncbi:SH3 domain-containing protein [Mesorhizobium sp. WSM4884]|uniref:SH3 domain-containing protein n=1 Tax=Mesorhizobium sp. WSM4884 TaxID=3038542 RepID=UPI002417F5B9|nr:SH3 domain-containing protein [Mesorhizobium sp. WSM4884]MDG4884453.1 SH3 domain-containing protein [Mesorhizobium sp. WSM4884]
MKQLIAALIAPVLLLVALSPSIAFEGNTLRVGGPGGQEFHDLCGPGTALASIDYDAGKDVDGMAMYCKALHGDKVEGPEQRGRTWGNPNAPFADAFGGVTKRAGGRVSCPEPLAVQAIYLTESAVKVVHDFWLLCRNLATGEHYKTSWSRTVGGAGGPAGNANCGDDAYAVGIWGGSGSMVDAIGLTCATFHPSVVNNPPPAVPEKPIKHTCRAGDRGACSTSSGGTPWGTVCVRYAMAAVKAVKENSSRGCGGTGIRWSSSGEDHVKWCMSHKDDMRLLDVEAKARSDALAACGSGTGNAGGSGDQTGGNDVGGGGTPQTPEDMGGMPPAQQADGACGGGNAAATVVIDQPGLDKLNVRSGPGGRVIGTVAEGDTVSVIGPCGAISGAAGFTKPKTQQGGGGGGAGGWCQISAPVHGCVSAQFLAFGGGDVGTLPGGAAGFAKSKSKPQEPASAGAGFSGRWSANADNVAYSLSLKQKGNSVSGNYQGADGSAGTISGKMSGNILHFSWVQKDGTRGSGKFVLADDGQSFDGTYNFSNNPDAVEGSWSGTRQ